MASNPSNSASNRSSGSEIINLSSLGHFAWLETNIMSSGQPSSMNKFSIALEQLPHHPIGPFFLPKSFRYPNLITADSPVKLLLKLNPRPTTQLEV
jgi:hypothetical protein